MITAANLNSCLNKLPVKANKYMFITTLITYTIHKCFHKMQLMAQPSINDQSSPQGNHWRGTFKLKGQFVVKLMKNIMGSTVRISRLFNELVTGKIHKLHVQWGPLHPWNFHWTSLGEGGTWYGYLLQLYMPVYMYTDKQNYILRWKMIGAKPQNKYTTIFTCRYISNGNK